jgi:putative Holliday junction resolvase
MPPEDRPWLRIAGIDYGTVRIGIAMASTEVGIASPYETYHRRNPQLDLEYFRRLAREERIDRFVVGLPVHLDGGESQKSREARTFGEQLEQITGVPVVYFDERFTSVEAEAELNRAGLTSKQRKARIDKLAAQFMLAGYLEALARHGDQAGQRAPQALD